MKAIFVELPAFTRYRADYLDEMADLSPNEKKVLKSMLKAELEARQ
jgi:hypothetical protein